MLLELAEEVLHKDVAGLDGVRVQVKVIWRAVAFREEVEAESRDVLAELVTRWSVEATVKQMCGEIDILLGVSPKYLAVLNEHHQHLVEVVGLEPANLVLYLHT